MQDQGTGDAGDDAKDHQPGISPGPHLEIVKDALQVNFNILRRLIDDDIDVRVPVDGQKLVLSTFVPIQ